MPTLRRTSEPRSPGGVWPSGGFNLNDEPGNTVANSAIVKLGASGSIDVYTSAPVNIIVDVMGVFVEVPAAVSGGRFVGVDPGRTVDTRLTGGRGAPKSACRFPLAFLLTPARLRSR